MDAGFRGASVLRLNHIGDWGTQFGMLIQHMNDRKEEGRALEGEGEEEDISDLQQLYRSVTLFRLCEKCMDGDQGSEGAL